MKPLRLLLLASGRGSHVANLIQATRDGRLAGSVVRVVSDRPDAPALERARELGVPTTVLGPVQDGARLSPEAEAELVSIVERERPDLIALCGFMRLLRASSLERIGVPVLNVHPSLLPQFRGLNETGATVHRVDAGMDTGTIVLQERVRIQPGESAEELAERLLPIEYKLYVDAIRKIQEEHS
jgi:phosphoribosylglycinamide formyltransferase-1